MAKTDAGLTGDFHIEINENRTEATLVFQSGTDADKLWTTQDIFGLLQAQNITGCKPDEIAKTCESIAKKKEKQVSSLVAKGMLATQPAAETLMVLDLPVPEAWTSAVQATLKNAHPPLIMVEVQDKVEKEQTVVKKLSARSRWPLTRPRWGTVSRPPALSSAASLPPNRGLPEKPSPAR